MTLPVVFTANGAQGYNLTKSLRFRSSASAYLNRTPASAGNQRTWTMSFWVKRGRITSATTQEILGCYSSSSDTGNFEFRFTTSDTLQCYLWNGGTTTNAVFRDPSAWYHVVLVIDTTQAGTSSGSKIKMYVNNVLQTFSSDYISGISQNTNLIWNATTAEYIGRWFASDGGTYYPDVYLSEMNFIDGQALTPSSFGQTDSATGVWQPAKYTGTYGTNGFYLPFTDTTSTTTISEDFSGNNNDWTSNNISLTSGVTYDSMNDVPTNTNATTANYAVLNPLTTKIDLLGVATLSNGNLQATSGGSNAMLCIGSIFITSGKWYAECTVTTSLSDYIGLASQTNANSTSSGTGAYSYTNAGTKASNGSSSAYGATYTTGDVIGVAYDADAGTLTFYKNGTSQGVAYSGIDVSVPRTFASFNAGTGTYVHNWNFGQRPFAYTPPTGFVALNTYNLPTPTIGATASSQANRYMDISLYSGNNSTPRSITGLNFQPDWVWIKDRSSAYNHTLWDVVRGVGSNKGLSSNSTDPEGLGVALGSTAANGYVSALNSNGFEVTSGTSTNVYVNTSPDNYVAWNWKANGSGVSNTAGSITSTVSANTTAGFSIVTYTGNGSSPVTIGHGLGVIPAMIILKDRDAIASWMVKHQNMSSNTNIFLEGAGGEVTPGNGYIQNLTSSTTFGVINGGSGVANVNTNGNKYVAYCFAQVAGYSAFGSYTGNGSSDGPFVFCGFRPRFIMIKRTDSTANWRILDTARDTYNVEQSELYPNLSNAEGTFSSLDGLSNGFKIRNSDAAYNASGGTYIYMAFAENPFKYSLAR